MLYQEKSGNPGEQEWYVTNNTSLVPTGGFQLNLAFVVTFEIQIKRERYQTVHSKAKHTPGLPDGLF
jgi:hypothetical protein